MKKLFSTLMLFQAVFWIVSAFLLVYHPAIYIKFLMAADGVLFAAFAFLYNRHLLFKIATALFLAVNTVLTLTDQMGAYDWAILFLNIASIAVFAYIVFGKRKGKKT